MKGRPRLIRYAFGMLAAAVALAVDEVLVEQAVHDVRLGETPPIGTITWLVSILVGVVLLPVIAGGLTLVRTHDRRRALRHAALMFAAIEVVALLYAIVLAGNIVPH